MQTEHNYVMGCQICLDQILDSKTQKPVLLQTGFIVDFFKVKIIFRA
jgi:hypothetical protein